MSILTIDFAKFIKGAPHEREQAARGLVQSFADHGFVKLLNCGFSDERVDELQDLNARFFDLEEELKQEVVNPPSPQPQRGWSFKGAETTSGLRKHENVPVGRLTDEKEHYDIGPADDVQYPNKWPDANMPEFRSFMEPFYESCQQLCVQIMSACEVGLKLPPNALIDRCKPASSELRLNYYPEVSFETLRQGRSKRGWPHTDFGIITLLFQDQVGGLEVQDRRHGRDARIGGTDSNVFNGLMRGPSSSELAVNVSDTFQRWTNNVIRAGVHRVDLPPNLNLSEEEGIVPKRYSTVFFFKADRQTSVGPLPYFVSQEHVAAYEDISALQFHKNMTQVLIQ